MTERRKWWAGQCASLASLGYAAGYAPLADEHYGELVRALLDDRHEVVWSGARPDRLRPLTPERHAEPTFPT